MHVKDGRVKTSAVAALVSLVSLMFRIEEEAIIVWRLAATAE